MVVKYFFNLVFIGLLTATNWLWAGNEASAEKLEEAKLRLRLTDKQVEDISPVLKDSWYRKNKLLLEYGIDLELGNRPESGLNFREARALGKDMDSVREETIQKLSDFLTNEQIA